MDAFNEESFELFNDKRVQTVSLVVYRGTERIVIGQATILGDEIAYSFNKDLPPDIAEKLTEGTIASFSASDVLHKDNPLFPANAYEVNEPLAEARLIDAILNIQSFTIIEEGETNG